MDAKEIVAFFSDLQPNNNFKRAGKLFHTKNNPYFYDAGTGKVFECGGNEYNIISALLNAEDAMNTLNQLLEDESNIEAIENIISLIESEHILKLPVYRKFTDENKDIDIYKNGKLKQISLELTEKCNLRCKYCIYDGDFDKFREFGQHDMTWEVAKAAIDFAYEHCGEDLIIGFYGGEPLLNFDVLKRSVEYSLEKFKNMKDLKFTVTSNLTLVTKEIAEYLANVPKMSVVCSLDGPQEIQNRYRVFPNKLGSYEKTLAGLKLIVDAMKDKVQQNLSIHSVLCPPFSEEKFNQMKNFFETIPWLPKDLQKDGAYVGAGTLKQEDGGVVLKDISYEEFYNQPMEVTDPAKHWAINELSDKNNMSTYAFRFEQGPLMKMHLRYITDKPAETMFRNACCTPGVRKLYVSTKGDFSVCERIGNAPSIGCLKDGFNYAVILESYVKEYDRHSIDKCNDCWALHLCPMCYALCYDKEGINGSDKDKGCLSSRSSVYNNLVEYYQIMEENPAIIDKLDDLYKQYS